MEETMKLYKSFYFQGGKHRLGGKYSHRPGWYFQAYRWWSRGKRKCLFGEFESEAKCQKLANQYARMQRWHLLWTAAYDNMPVRVKHDRDWIEQKRGVTKLPDFIKGVAKKRMKQVDGVLFAIKEKPVQYGRHMALCRCLDMVTRFSKQGNNGRLNHHWLSNAMVGVKPRDPARRGMLLRLAGPNGNAIARQKLTELGIIHWYQS